MEVFLASLLGVLVIALLVIHADKKALAREKDKLLKKLEEVDRLQSEIRRLHEENRRLQDDARAATCALWLRELADLHLVGEREVEVKFLAPLVWFLGYHGCAVRLRVPVTLTAGRERLTVEADWVLYNPARSTAPDGAFIVIEAKAPEVALDAAVQAQARSYAFGLGAPLYLLTNGRRLALFRLDLPTDRCLLDCPVEQLAEVWVDLERQIGAESPSTPAMLLSFYGEETFSDREETPSGQVEGTQG